MFLSSLLIDLGEDPDRPRPARFWLRNLYRVHQRLCMAFPSASRKSDDVDFLKPFKPEDFGREQVNMERDSDRGFLFRIDPQGSCRSVILVQSGIEPEWDYAFKNSGHFLAAPPQVRHFEPCFASGQRFGFRLMANATRKIDTKSGPDGRRRHGRRVPVPAERLHEWLARWADVGGFSVERDSLAIQPGYVYFNKSNATQQRLFSVRYDGVLTVGNPERFHETLVQGIGPGKAFGFGLLSVRKP